LVVFDYPVAQYQALYKRGSFIAAVEMDPLPLCHVVSPLLSIWSFIREFGLQPLGKDGKEAELAIIPVI
jgi:hypothetical protein